MSLNNPNLSLATVNEAMWGGALTLGEEGRKWHRESGFPAFFWSSMARGYFAYVDDADVKRVYDNEINQKRRERAEEIGKKHGLSAPQVALAWTLAQPGEVFALCGLRTVDNAKQSLDVLDVELTPEEVHYLEFGA